MYQVHSDQGSSGEFNSHILFASCTKWLLIAVAMCCSSINTSCYNEAVYIISGLKNHLGNNTIQCAFA